MVRRQTKFACNDRNFPEYAGQKAFKPSYNSLTRITYNLHSTHLYNKKIAAIWSLDLLVLPVACIVSSTWCPPTISNLSIRTWYSWTAHSQVPIWPLVTFCVPKFEATRQETRFMAWTRYKLPGQCPEASFFVPGKWEDCMQSEGGLRLKHIFFTALVVFFICKSKIFWSLPYKLNGIPNSLQRCHHASALSSGDPGQPVM